MCACARTAAEAAAAPTAEADPRLQQHSGATTELPSEHLTTEIQSKNVFSCSGHCGCDGCGGGSRPRAGARLHRRGAGGKLHHRRPGESLARARLALIRSPVCCLMFLPCASNSRPSSRPKAAVIKCRWRQPYEWTSSSRRTRLFVPRKPGNKRCLLPNRRRRRWWRASSQSTWPRTAPQTSRPSTFGSRCAARDAWKESITSKLYLLMCALLFCVDIAPDSAGCSSARLCAPSFQKRIE